MADSQKSDVVETLGNVLTDFDLLLASPDLSQAKFNELRKVRRGLDKAQLKIVAAGFRENTKRFQDAVGGLNRVNADLQYTITNAEKVATTIESVTTLIDSADKLLSIAIV
jgi:hypothetical protein